MRVVQINSTCGTGSIGKICLAVSRLLTDNGVENYILCKESNGYPNAIVYTTPLLSKIAALESRIYGNYGFNSYYDTKKMIRLLDNLNPDIVHIHNIHSHNCNVEMLLGYLAKKHIKVYYTFHDCWAFTGYCTYFDVVNCERWKIKCFDCKQKRKYSWILDKSQDNFLRKQRSFSKITLTIITPSRWLAGLVEQSFLHENKVRVINNGIDLNVFHPTPSNFREKYNCEGKVIILGVSMGWEERKGLDTFIRLSRELPSKFQIVLVGTNNKIDKKLPNNIISIHRTRNQIELAQIYSSADVFINPTMEENFPTTNIEAIACGIPVITYNSGGSAEMLDDNCGLIIERGDYNTLYKTICQLDYIQIDSNSCVKRATQFAQEKKFQEYIDLYGI